MCAAALRAGAGGYVPDHGRKRPLFVLLDATWPEARKMFRKSPYLDKLPVLNVQSEQLSNYKLRRSQQDSHFCTSEVAALCLALGGEALAAQTLGAYLDVFTSHYLRAKQQLPVNWASRTPAAQWPAAAVPLATV